MFGLAIRGVSNKGMARCLGISEKTIETHRARINHCCDVHTTAGLILYAVREGLLTAENVLVPISRQVEMFAS